MTDDLSGPASPEPPVLSLPRRLQKLVLSYLVADVLAAAGASVFLSNAAAARHAVAELGATR